MKKVIVSALMLCIVLNATAFAGLSSKKAAYQGGTTKDKDFAGAKDAVEGVLNLNDEKELKFSYKQSKVKKEYSIPYNQFIDIEYGQKAGRRVGAAIATAILVSPVGLFLLFSKKRKHYVTIGYKGPDGKEEVAIFELGKDIVRTTLPILEAHLARQSPTRTKRPKKRARVTNSIAKAKVHRLNQAFI